MGDYPTEDDLKKVEKWPHPKFGDLMDFVKSIWWAPEWGWDEGPGNDEDRTSRTFKVSTGGWSGNESIIGAMRSNTMFWLFCWQSSRRGGHYEFTIPSKEKIGG